jgi:putative transposase
MHIVQRGHDRRECFRTDDDFRHYRSLLGDSAQRASCEVHAYVLMTNHVHLLVTPRDHRAAARMMHRAAGVYGHRFNSKYERSGTVWEGRYWSCLIESERHLFACSRYLELNPVRAGMVNHPRDYRWSSYRANAECGDDPLLTPHLLYNGLGGTNRERAASYADLFSLVIDPAALKAIRRPPGRRP